jgi:hypothetical protein
MPRDALAADCSALALFVITLALFNALSCAALLACFCLVLAVTLDPTCARAVRTLRAFRITSPTSL